MKYETLIMEGPQKSIGKWELWPVSCKADERAMAAYRLRLKCRLDWHTIARRTLYADAACAHKSARRYAKRHGKQWPLPLGQFSQGELAYAEFEDGASWYEVANFIDIACHKRARQIAWKWARYHDKPWPPVRK